MKKEILQANRCYKDRLFRLLFGSEEMKENIILLYNALNGTNYTNVDDFQIVTLEDAIYMSMKNDVGLLVDSALSLWEQQSTYNPNMPVRGLIYISNMYTAYIERHELNMYGTTLLKLPTPRYVVFYNGKEDLAPITKLRLSDAFIHPDDSHEFEWTATMYNLNRGKNDKLRSQCKPLDDYMHLIEYIQAYQKAGNSVDVAVDRAVDRCIKEGKLEEFLRKHRAEVKNVCITEFNEEVFVKGIKEEGREEGIKEGLKKGLKEGLKEGLKKGEDVLVQAVLDKRNGFTQAQLIEKYGERTAQKAILLG